MSNINLKHGEILHRVLPKQPENFRHQLLAEKCGFESHVSLTDKASDLVGMQ